MPREKDTKGWILFKSGKASEGLALILEAAAKVPDDPDVQSHLIPSGEHPSYRQGKNLQIEPQDSGISEIEMQ